MCFSFKNGLGAFGILRLGIVGNQVDNLDLACNNSQMLDQPAMLVHEMHLKCRTEFTKH